MDILNFISWIRGRRQVTSVDPAKTLLPVGIKDPKRDDEYLAGAISVEDLAAQIAPEPAYKVYTALLTQSGINPPVATVLENTLGVTPTYIYEGVGQYSIALNGGFTIVKTWQIISSNNIGAQDKLEIYDNGNDSVWIDTNLADDKLTNTPIEIRVYN